MTNLGTSTLYAVAHNGLALSHLCATAPSPTNKHANHRVFMMGLNPTRTPRV